LYLRRERVEAMRAAWLSVMVLTGTLVFGSLWTAVPGQAAAAEAVHVAVTSTRHSVSAPGEFEWTVRITNRTGRSMSGLRLGEEVILNGDPGHGATRPFAPGGCTAAAGTAYCPLPVLRPGASISRHGFAQVPVRFSATAPSNVGSLLETREVVATRTGQIVSNEARLAVPVTGAVLPHTGEPFRRLVTIGLLCVATGVVLLRNGQRCYPRRSDLTADR
jgi:hypothetical protein